MNCLICLNKSEGNFNIFEGGETEQSVVDIIKKHLWFLEDQLNKKSDKLKICNACWKTVENFNLFFNEVQEKHHNKLISNIKEEPFQDEEEIDKFLTESYTCNVFVKEEEVKESSSDSSKEIEERLPRKSKQKKKRPPSKSESGLVDEESEKVVVDFCKLKCEICSTEFDKYLPMKQHYKKEHSIDGYVACCSRKFYKFVRIYEHVKLHLNPDSFQCDICKKNMSSKETLNKHRKRHTSRIYPCPHKDKGCPKIYSSKYQLKVHIQTHEIVHLRTECDLCGKIFSNRKKIQKHISAVHIKPEACVCDLCGKVLLSKGNLKTHQETMHQEVDRIQCKICNHWLKNHNSYRRHVKKHEDEKQNHICSHCFKPYKNSRVLKKHIETVHCEEKYECKYCPKKFKMSKNLTEHVAALHTGQSLYGCPFCDRAFNSSANLAVHRKKNHPVEWALHIKPKYLP